MKTQQTESFLKINNLLLSSVKLSSSEKIVISYILGWQLNDKDCFETNQSMAKKLGLKVRTLNTILRIFKDDHKFLVLEYPTYTTRLISIDNEELDIFLTLDVIKTVVVKEVKIKTILEPTQPEIVQQIQETVVIIEPIKVKEDKIDLVKILTPFVKSKDEKTNDKEFDIMLSLIDLTKKLMGTTSQSFTKTQLIKVASFIEDKTEYGNKEQILELQVLLTNDYKIN